jgi:hypothetical protein
MWSRQCHNDSSKGANMRDGHYDGDSPNEPLPPEHFTEQQRKEAAELGDGSPALDPRGGRSVERDADTDAAETTPNEDNGTRLNG